MSTRKPVANRLREALEDGIGYARGKVILRTHLVGVPTIRSYSAVEVMRIRERLGASQATFARYLSVNVKTLQSWEQGLRTPSRPTMRLLQVFDEPQEFAPLLSSVAEKRASYDAAAASRVSQ